LHVFFIAADKIGETCDEQTPEEEERGVVSQKDEFFLDKYVYIAISSLSGCSLEVVITGSESRQALMKEKLAQHYAEKKALYAQAASLFTDEEPFYREMLAMVA